MRVGLAGSRASADLKVLKREIEDLGHNAVIFNPRKFPQYATGSLGAGGDEICARTRGHISPSRCAVATYDHLSLLDLDSLYIGDLEGRDAFFRGYFDRDIWAALRERYLEFASSEVDISAFQMSFLLAAAERLPTVNRPEAIMTTRLRPYALWKIARQGIAVWPFEIRRASGRRVREAEDRCYDVPCFQRGLKHTLSLVGEAPARVWRAVVAAGAHPATRKMIVDQGGHLTGAPAPTEVGDIASRLLGIFGLAVAEIELVPAEGKISVLGISAFPHLAEFEEVTGERVGALVAQVLTGSGGRDRQD